MSVIRGQDSQLRWRLPKVSRDFRGGSESFKWFRLSEFCLASAHISKLNVSAGVDTIIGVSLAEFLFSLGFGDDYFVAINTNVFDSSLGDIRGRFGG